MSLGLASARRCAVAICSLAVAACSPARDASSRDDLALDPPATEVVTNERTAWATGAGWTVSPEPKLTIGVEGAERYQFSNIVVAARRSDGSLVVADDGASLVRLYSAGGELRATLGRQGAGPGEFQLPRDVLIGASDSIVVWDDRLWRRTTFDADGNYVRDETFRPDRVWQTTAPLYPMRAWLLPDGGLVSLLEEKSKPPATMGTFRPAAGAIRVGADLDSFAEIARFPGPEQLNVDAPWGPTPVVPALARRSVLARQPNGDRICYGDQAHPEVRCVDAGGTVRAIRWSGDQRATGDRRRAIDAWRSETMETYGQKMSQDAVRRLVDEVPVADPAAFHRLLIDRDGYLWVELGTTADGRVFYVFDPDGALLGDVALPDVRVVEIGSDYLLAVHHDPYGVQRLQMFDLYRTPTGAALR